MIVVIEKHNNRVPTVIENAEGICESICASVGDEMDVVVYAADGRYICPKKTVKSIDILSDDAQTILVNYRNSGN